MTRSTFHFALVLAARDLRGGLRGFAVFIAAIAIGVAAIVGVSALSRGLSDGLAREGRTLLGGDLSFGLLQREASATERAFLDKTGATLSLAFLRAMARAPDGGATMIELKAVDGAYPAFGTLATRPQAAPADLFGAKDGVFGVAVDPVLTGRLGLKAGDALMIGTTRYVIRAEIATEPDRVAGGVGFGPRVLMSQEGLRASGLLQPGSLVRWAYRVALPGAAADTAQLARVEATARAAFPEAGFDIRTRENAAPQLQRNLERFTQFLTLVGLTALAVGGVGVANAARAFTDRKRLTVAALKGVGASGSLMFLTLLIEVLAIGLLGSALGAVIGSLLPFALKAGLGAALPVPFVASFYPREILVGVAYAARAFTDRKRMTVAALKGVGASGALMFLTLLIEVMAIGLIGSALGAAVGSTFPFLIKGLVGAALPAPFVADIYAREIAVGVAYGLATVAAFAIWPLGRAHDIPVSALFRDMAGEDKAWPRPIYMLMVAAAAAVLIVIAVAFAWDRRIALIYVGAAGVAFVLLRAVASGVMALAAALPRPRGAELRLALGNIHRPGALTPSVFLSLGLGLTLLVALALIDHNLRSQLTSSLPAKAPSFFFLDIPAAETDDFAALIKEKAPTGALERVPMMRGRVTALKGVPASQIKADDKAAWVLEGDRGLTFAAAPPAGAVIVDGKWWDKDHAGPPLVSMEVELARGLGLAIGDSISVNVLGRTITASIANLRKVEWQSLGINFVLVFSPNAFAGAPYSNLATLTFPEKASDAAEIAVLKAAAEKFPSVSSIRVKEALETIDALVANLALAVRGASAIALLASVIVLGGALAAGRRVRARESVILKTLGATRRSLILALVVEYGVLGLAASIFGLLAGAGAGFYIVTTIMKLSFSFPWPSMLGLVLTALCVVIILGLAGTWRILGQKPATYLRNA